MRSFAARMKNSERCRAYYLLHRERILARKRAYYAANPAHVRAIVAKYRASIKGGKNEVPQTNSI